MLPRIDFVAGFTLFRIGPQVRRGKTLMQQGLPFTALQPPLNSRKFSAYLFSGAGAGAGAAADSWEQTPEWILVSVRERGAYRSVVTDILLD